MRVDIRQVENSSVRSMIRRSLIPVVSSDEKVTMEACIKLSSTLWIGLVGGDVACLWGIVTPTLLSDECYLWLYTTDLIKEHQFIFIRHSQRFVEDLLKKYTKITGYATAGADQSLKWLKWLGATFEQPIGNRIPFTIRRK